MRCGARSLTEKPRPSQVLTGAEEAPADWVALDAEGAAAEEAAALLGAGANAAVLNALSACLDASL